MSFGWMTHDAVFMICCSVLTLLSLTERESRSQRVSRRSSWLQAVIKAVAVQAVAACIWLAFHLPTLRYLHSVTAPFPHCNQRLTAIVVGHRHFHCSMLSCSCIGLSSNQYGIQELETLIVSEAWCRTAWCVPDDELGCQSSRWGTCHHPGHVLPEAVMLPLDCFAGVLLRCGGLQMASRQEVRCTAELQEQPASTSDAQSCADGPQVIIALLAQLLQAGALLAQCCLKYSLATRCGAMHRL